MVTNDTHEARRGVSVNAERLVASLRHHEGLRLRVYNDSVGVPTIGYGRNLRDVGISKWMAEAMFEVDLWRHAFDATRVVPSFHKLSDARQEVLVEMVFNLGATGLSKFKNTLRFIAEEDWENAAAEMLDSKWAEQVGHRAVRLSRKFLQG